MQEQKLLKKKIKAQGNSGALVSVCTDLASYYICNGQFAKAVKEYETLCKIYKEEKQMILYAQANRGIGEAYMGLQAFDKALKHFKIYFEVAVQEHNILEQQRALAQLGHLYLTWYLETFSESNRKYLDEAYGYFVRSMKKCESLPDGLEKQDMIARLFSNLGLVKENLGDLKTAHNLYEKSIKICLKNDFYEQLYRGYMSTASLLEKQENYQETMKSYNMAIDIAKKLSSKRVELVCAALLAKSETLIRLADFQGAKQVLRKAYKLKTPNRKEAKEIENHLRVVAGMCKIEDDIIICNEDRRLKLLYEKMGDGACDLRNFSKAIEYYKKMLEAAERSGATDKELSECYYSLGETYKDNGQYKEAEIFYEKEYELCKTSLKDSLNTICKIADLKEMANDGAEVIKKIYERGLAHCRNNQNLKEEKRLVLRYMNFLRRSSCHKDAHQMEQYLKTLDNKIGEEELSSSSECESEDSTKIHVGDDIILSEVTDISEESDNESSITQPAKRRKQSTVKFKKNLNGEWPLHVACIKGNIKMVQYWLEVGHPVNVRDNAGWLPLHEAAVHGHLEIVRMLLDRKASINDRGGSECNGITPLHDAASNGHLHVMELLLDRGASAVAKTDHGNTPLFEMKKWYENNSPNLEGEELVLYNKLGKRLEEALNKAGQKDPEKTTFLSSPNKKNACNSVKIGHLRRNFHLENTGYSSNDEETSGESDPEPAFKTASNEYKMVMQTLRHKNCGNVTVKAGSSKRSALIAEEDFVDPENWLEEDVRPAKSSKKRKIMVWERNNSSFGARSPGVSPTKRGLSAPIEADPRESEVQLLSDDFNWNEPVTNQRRYSTDSNDSHRSSRRRQSTLLDSGFVRERMSNSPKINNLKRVSSDRSTYGKHSVAEADSTTLVFRQTETAKDPTLFVDVEIESKAFRVPVLMSQLQSKTIKWLAQEAARRYESKEYMKPVLELETLNGVILGDNDLLSLLFPMGSVQAERVVGKVTQWSLPSVSERYKETCLNMGISTNNELDHLAQTLSVTLSLKNRGILPTDLSPLLKAINNQKSLTEINLSGNFLNSQAINSLSSSLATLNNLQNLNLSCTGMRRSHLTQLASCIATSSLTLSKLQMFDISDNIALKNDCLKDLGVVTTYLNLKRLDISNIGLSSPLDSLQGIQLKSLEDFNLSYNQLSDEDVRKFLCCLDGFVLKKLNLARNRCQRVLRHILDVMGNELIVLENINLEDCGVSDTDLFDFLRLASNVSSINLNHNPALTSISLRRLLEHGNLSYLNLVSCENIWTYFDPQEKGWSVQVNNKKTAVFKVSGRYEHFNCLVNMFKEKYEFVDIEVNVVLVITVLPSQGSLVLR